MTTRDSPAYWIVWNGSGQFGDRVLRPRYRPEARTVDLVRCSEAPPNSYPVLLCRVRRNVKFTVPRVPDGTYPVLIYDGSEGGGHYTWDLFRVTAEDESDFHLGVALLAGGAALLLAAAYGAKRSISHASASRR